jgi:hypothetical protein
MKTYGEYARERVKREFNKEMVSEKTFDLYQRIL